MRIDVNYLKVEEAADYLSISKWMLYYYIKSENIPHIRLGRHIRLDKERLDIWLRQNHSFPANEKTEDE